MGDGTKYTLAWFKKKVTENEIRLDQCISIRKKTASNPESFDIFQEATSIGKTIKENLRDLKHKFHGYWPNEDKIFKDYFE